MSDPRFVHLRIHSDYSMIDGVAKVKPILGKVAELGMAAFALTDHTNFCGLVKFYSGCHDKALSPLSVQTFLCRFLALKKSFVH